MKLSTQNMKNYKNHKLEIANEFTSNTETNCKLATDEPKHSKKTMNKIHRKESIEKSQKGK